MNAAITEGKTKIIWKTENNRYVNIQNKDNLTAGDGEKRDSFKNKGKISNQITCNIFEFLQNCGVASHYIKQINNETFKALKCKMAPLEVVARRRADGSYLKRNPGIEKGTVFPRLIVEFYLKDDLMHDPLIKVSKEIKNPYYPTSYYPAIPPKEREYWHLYDAKKPHCLISVYDAKCPVKVIKQMENQIRFIFLLLEKAWKNLGVDLWDLKLEFGYSAENNELLLADVIDNDSWRITKDGVQLDKQIFRDGNAPMDEIKKRYKLVADLTSHFKEMANGKNNIYHPKVVILYGSEKNASCIDAIRRALSVKYEWKRTLAIRTPTPDVNIKDISKLLKICHKNTYVIFICLADLSNFFAPIAATHTVAPLIFCSPTAEKLPIDTWSYIRLLDKDNRNSILTPKQAALQALKIIAGVNPLIYAKLQTEIEKDLNVNAYIYSCEEMRE
jgi:phosphoribosylaminoimidazole-succinocarboxamide synthase